MLGRAEPFENDHLGGDDLGAVPCQARNRRFLTFRAARGDRVAHQIDAPSGIEQPERGLHDTDMGFAAGDDDVAPISQTVEKVSHTAGVERNLVRQAAIREIRQLGDRRTEPAGIVLGEQDRDAEYLCRLDQAACIG